ncbi:hypothetical protein ABIE44_000091 [Marmoricola sp. OAE513]|uniref:ribbon-helix-helix protein, CopG family n=1 Tax=Marmoricola sp. OAE513 TaxID=2817894 RepID=UPI001AE4EACD
MSHRTQITLQDEQYALLRAESARTGLGLAELVRRALDATYGASISAAERRTRLDLAFGLWADRDDDELEQLQASLRPGLGHKLASL